MADRYWVGGTGSWSSTNTANWSDTSGGASGFSVPTAADNVFFDANSNVGTGAFTVTMANTPRVCNDITISGLDGTMTLAGTSIGLTVSGSLSFPATNFTRSYTGTTTFNATTTGKTITTNGIAFGAAVTLDGVGGAWTLGSAFSCGTSTLTLTNGTFDTSTSNYAVTAGTFSSTNSNTRTINLNGSTITLSGSWTMTTSTNATLNAGTSQITLTSSSIISFNGGGLTYYNVSFTTTSGTASTKAINGTNTFNNLTFSTLTSAGLPFVSVNGNQIINGTFTANGANGNQRMFFRSSILNTPYTLTCAAIAAMTDVDFRDITIAGAHGTLSGTRLGDCGGNSNITFVAGANKYWNLAAGGNWNANGWATSSGGGVATTNYPLPQDTVIIENTGLNTSATITINGDWNIGTLDTSTRTNAMTLASSTNSPTFYGNFTYGSGVTPTGTATYAFFNRSIKTLNSGGKTFTQNVTVDALSGGIQLLTNNLTLGSTRTFNFREGTLDLNNLVLTTGLFTAQTTAVNKTIAFGTGNISCSGTGTIWLTTGATDINATGTPVVNITSSGSTAIGVNTSFTTESNAISFNFTGGTYALTISSASSASFKNLNFTGYSGTATFSSSNTIFGNLTASTGMTFAATTSTLTFGATSGIQQITSNGKTMDFPITFNGVGGTFRLEDAMTVGATRTTTLTNGALNLNNLTLTTGLFNANNSNLRSIAFGTGNISCSGTGTVWNTATSTSLTTTGTQVVNVTSVGSTSINVFPGSLSSSNSISFNFTGGTYALSVSSVSSSYVRNLNFTGYAGAFTIPVSVFLYVYGDLTLSTGMTAGGSGDLSFIGTSGTQQITSNGITINTGVIFNGSSLTTYRLQDAAAFLGVTLSGGTLNLNGYTCTLSNFQTGSGTKNLTFNGGTLVSTGQSSFAWNNASPTNFTTTAGTGTGTISMTSASAKTFIGGGSTYNCTLNQGGAGTLTITGANTFNNITNTNATASQITFPASTTTTVSNFTLSGSSGNGVSLRSSTSGTRFNLSKSSGTVSVSFLNIQDSNATGGATWEAFLSNGNVNSGNNLGWDFGAVSGGGNNFFLLFA